ncbi:MAG: chemotaxis protein CheB [Pseudomonadota bacterium]
MGTMDGDEHDELDWDTDPARPYVIGIGASAGGLEALRELVQHLPEKTGATYVVVQHMSPDHRSMLAELISREAHLDVREIDETSELRPDTIFVTPPNHDVELRDQRLVLLPPSFEVASPKPSVDRFLISMAEARRSKCMAIILSGTGSDGAYGVQAVREAGGITLAQDDATAKYDGMPRAAIETECVDLVLSPNKMGTHMANILSSPGQLEQFRGEEATLHPLSDLLQVVLARTRVDFREYKLTTIQRRLERRMTALNIKEVAQYTAHCRVNPTEVDALFKDLLISVTRFFRDPDEFKAIRPIIRRIVREKQGRTIRIWVAGCATGEEAYSIGMLFAAELEAVGEGLTDAVQIFATDIDKHALSRAREGRYSQAALADIPRDIAERYLTHAGDAIVISRTVREMILFSEHNVCQDPPFLHLDMVCCRNLMIYFGPQLQEKVLSRVHYALNQDGYMFLGVAESATITSDLFRSAENQSHIFRKRGQSNSDFGYVLQRRPRASVGAPARTSGASLQNGFDSDFNKALFEQLAAQLGPDALLVSDDLRIVRIFGDVSRFLKLTSETNLSQSTAVLRPEIAQEVRTQTTVAFRKNLHRRSYARKNEDEGFGGCRVDVYPLNAPALEDGFALVCLNDNDPVRDQSEQFKFSQSSGEGAVNTLQSELDMAREALQQTVEELETSNEEFQSTNEELQSANEELQASNEELETANEELQSTNEELITVNEELQVAKAELEIAADEQRGVLESLSAPILIVDNALQVSSGNQAAIDFFKIATPGTRPHLSQLAVPQGFPALAEVCNDAIFLGQQKTMDIELRGEAFVISISPFYSAEGRARGATVILTDARQANQLNMVFKSADVFLMHRKTDGTVLFAQNTIFQNANPDRAIEFGKLSLRDMLQPGVAALSIAADKAFIDGDQDYNRHLRKLGSPFGDDSVYADIHKVRVENPGDADSVFVFGRYIHELTSSDFTFRQVIDNKYLIAMLRDADGVVREISDLAATLLGRSREEATGRHLSELLPPEAAEIVLSGDAAFLAGEGDARESTAAFDHPTRGRIAIRSMRSLLAPLADAPPMVLSVGCDVSDLIDDGS